MTLPSQSVKRTAPVSGDDFAVVEVAGKKYLVSVIADESGHFQQSLPTYHLWIPPVAVGANKLHWDLFNGASSGLKIELRGIWAIPKQDVTVTGVLGVEYGLFRTSAVGTGGTAAGYNTGNVLTSPVITPADTLTDPDLTLGATTISARLGPTGGATISAPWWGQYVQTEEAATSMAAIQAFQNLLPVGTMNKRLTLNPGQGILAKQGSVAGVGSIACLVCFTAVAP